jgi:nucleotide-binding universal stress UspA family protein
MEREMQTRIAVPITSREEAEQRLPQVQSVAERYGCPIHLVWIIDVSPFMHWSVHGPVVDASGYGDSVPRRRLAATGYLSSLAKDLTASGIPASYEVRAGLPAFEMSALHRQGDVLVIEADPESEQSREAVNRMSMPVGIVGANDEHPAMVRTRALEGLDSALVPLFAGPHMADELCCGL